MQGDDVVLVIDDDPAVTQTLRDYIAAEGHAVAVAHTGAAGLQRIREGGVGLVLLDLFLPDMKGTAVMREALRDPAPPEFIIVTGHATLDSAIEAVEGSAAGYLPKPVDFPRLGMIVRRVFERRRLTRENARLQREVADRLAESEALGTIATAVSSTLDVQESLRRICRELVRLLGADTAAAYRMDPTIEHIVPVAAYHLPKEHMATLATATLPLKEQGFYLPLWRDRSPVASDDVVHDERFTHPLFRAFPHQSSLLLPLTLDGEVVGAFYVVWWTARRSFTEREWQLLERVTAQVGLLLRNARLFEQAERNQHRLEVLNEVSRRLAAVHEQEEVLALIVNEAARLLHAEAAGLRLLEGEDLVVGARTESAAALMARPRIKPGESLTGRVVTTGTPIVVEDLGQDKVYDPAHKRAAVALGYRGFVGVPLRSHGRILGTLNIYTKGARHFLPDEISLLAALADQASTAIEKARLFRETEEGQRLLARLYQAAIAMQSSWERDDRLRAFVGAAREVVGFDRVNVLLLTADGAGLELVTAGGDESAPGLVLPLGPGAGPFHEAFERRRPVAVLSDEDLGRARPLDRAHLDHPYLRSRRFVVAPLVVGERVIGVVSADNKPSRRPINPSSVEPFNALCQNLAIALEESRLYAETQAREQEMRKLYEVTRQLAVSLDRERLLDVIVAQTIALTGCDASGIYVYDEVRGGLTFRRGLNLDPDVVRDLVLKPGEGVAGRAYQERRPVWTRDRLADPELRYSAAGRPHLAKWQSRAYLAVPIVSRDEVYGVLGQYFFTAHDFTTKEIQLVSTLADHAALALENARLLEDTRRREAEARTLSRGLELLNQATRALHRTLEVEPMLARALEELAQAFGADGVLVNLLAADGRPQGSIGHWVTGADRSALPVRKGGITDFVRDARAPVLLRDVHERPDLVHPMNLAQGVKSIAAFPIVGQQEQVLGVLLLYYRTPQRFPDNEVRLLALYADQLATALENARLYEETQTQRVRLAQIFASTSDGIVLVGRSGAIQAANRRAGELLGFNADEVVGVGLAELLAGYRSSVADYDHVFAAVRALLDDPDRGGEGDLELRRMGRIIHWVGQPTTDAAGETIGFTLTLRDVTQERQVAQMKTDFVSFVTHQLRTPLAGIKWMLELAAQTPGVPREAADFVQDARQAAERLIGLVNDLLDASRLESGKLKIELRPLDLAALTGSVLDELGPLVREKGHRLAVEGADAVSPVMADPQLLRQVVLNLASNAIKYTSPGGEVTVRMAVEPGAVRWSIKDSGIGIPARAQARLFEKFYRADNALTVETEGTGLGLYLVRLIVEKFAGQVWCESEAGKGSTFIFTLPIAGRGR